MNQATHNHKRRRIEIDPSPYMRSHMKAPRGRGSWAFSVNGDERIENLLWVRGSHTFRDACKLAKEQAPEGTFVLGVQP